MKDRIYLDYNATSPLSKKVIDFLGKGDFLFANPASIHTAGKKSKKSQSEVESFLLNTFGLQSSHLVYFHSGATEALNTFFNLEINSIMIYSAADHAAVLEIAKFNANRGIETLCIENQIDGRVDLAKLEEHLQKSTKKVFFNFTWIGNESGILSDLKRLIELKEKYEFYIHVDAVQTIMRFDAWNMLYPQVEAYSYSAHKFGALKGIGFSFIKNGYKLKPLIVGGGQQKGIRSGTENTLGVATIKLALEDIIEKGNLLESYKFRDKIKALFKEIVGENGIIICENNNLSSACTVALIFKKHKSDISLMHFDLQGIDVSFGSACSSGSIGGATSLLSMGLSEYQKHFIRISYGPESYMEEKNILLKLKNVFESLSK